MCTGHMHVHYSHVCGAKLTDLATSKNNFKVFSSWLMFKVEYRKDSAPLPSSSSRWIKKERMWTQAILFVQGESIQKSVEPGPSVTILDSMWAKNYFEKIFCCCRAIVAWGSQAEAGQWLSNADSRLTTKIDEKTGIKAKQTFNRRMKSNWPQIVNRFSANFKCSHWLYVRRTLTSKSRKYKGKIRNGKKPLTHKWSRIKINPRRNLPSSRFIHKE